MKRLNSAAFAIPAILALAGTTALAQPFSLTSSSPTIDRWNYPFGDFGGTRSTIPVFTTLGSPYQGQNGFDDRDAEMLIGFDTSPTIPLVNPANYHITSATVRVMINLGAGQPGFAYDPTYDSVQTYPDFTGTSPQPDADAGRPIELFGCGYRAGWTAATFLESSPFNTNAPVIDPARECRNVFPIDFGTTGTPRDVSNNITGPGGVGSRFDVYPIAIAQAVGIAQSDLVTIDPPPAVGAAVSNRTIFEFSINLNAPGVRDYLAQGLSGGRINLMVTSLNVAPPFGSGPVTYPIFFAKGNPFGLPAQLNIVGSISSACNPADICGAGATYDNGSVDLPPDGQLSIDDFLVFLSAFSDATNCPGTARCNPADICGAGATYDNGAVDIGPDGQLSIDDFLIFLSAFSDATGCP